MSSIEELTQDIEELRRLLEVAQRPHVRALLTSEIAKCEKTAAGDKTVKSEQSIPAPESKTTAVPQKYFKDITRYGWDQSDKFMKIYVSTSDIKGVTKDNVTVEYTNNSFRLRIENADGKNYQCHVGQLWSKIVPSDCYHKLKSDSVLIMLKKAEEKKTWAFVTEREGKADKNKKDKFKTDKNDDPNAGLMNLLKQMYDDGDDEMKRMINKSWSESRDKTGGGDMIP